VGLAAPVSNWFPAQSSDPPVGGARPQVRTHTVGQVVVLDVDGPLSEVVTELAHAIRLALAEGPRGVVCDLSAVFDDEAPGAMRLLAAAGRHVRDWPGIPVAVACPDEQVRNNLRSKPLGEHLLVTASVRLALSSILRSPTTVVQSLRLTPHPTSPRAARDFVSRTLLDWQLGQRIPIACLLVSELATNAMLHAGTAYDVSLAAHLQDLRVSVRDHSPGMSMPHGEHLDLNGRGVTLLADLSRAWGVLPAADGGKIVWAVLDAHPGQATISHDHLRTIPNAPHDVAKLDAQGVGP
jgi:hypothetical protein